MADRIEGFDAAGGLSSNARIQRESADRQRETDAAEERRRRQQQDEALREAERSRGRGGQIDTFA